MKQWLCAFLVVLAAGRAWAGQPNYPDFADVSQLQLNGIATQETGGSKGILRLSHSGVQGDLGSCFTTQKIDASGFNAYFEFQTTNCGGDRWWPQGGTGFVFVLQGEAAEALGLQSGGCMAYGEDDRYPPYGGITPSVAVEFDMAQNNYENFWDPNHNHIGIDVNANMVSLATANPPGTMMDGAVWYVWLDYDGSTLDVYISTSDTKPASPTLSYAIDIPAILGATEAHIGFASATGSGWQDQDILAMTYTPAIGPALIYDGFNDHTGLTANGSAEFLTSGAFLRLARTDNAGDPQYLPINFGSAFTTQQFGINTFATEFEFEIHNAGGTSFWPTGGCGLAFLIQGEGATALGLGGGCNGFGDEARGATADAIKPSVAIEFDTAQNDSPPDWVDPDHHHVGICINGDMADVVSVGVLPDFEDTGLWKAWIEYDGAELKIYAGHPGKPSVPTLTYAIDIPAIVGSERAWVGFTAGASHGWADHDVLSWAYDGEPGDASALLHPEPSPITVEETSAAATAETDVTVSDVTDLSGWQFDVHDPATGPSVDGVAAASMMRSKSSAVWVMGTLLLSRIWVPSMRKV
ncbi:hypothetical protein ACFL09_04900 [Planctomycetota bacterium]